MSEMEAMMPCREQPGGLVDRAKARPEARADAGRLVA
jgi:hypothetical protein